MAKFGWSLPPGCNTLPDEDAAASASEALIESLYDAISPLRPAVLTDAYEAKEDEVVNVLERLVLDVMMKSRADAIADDAMAKEMEQDHGP